MLKRNRKIIVWNKRLMNKKRKKAHTLFERQVLFMDKKQKQTHPEVGEDATQYGEFVSSYFAWIPLPDQKKKAEEMAELTKKSRKKK